jgi:hypothetical protein
MVPCPLCSQLVDWMTVEHAASVLDVSEQRVRQLIKEGAFPNARKHAPGSPVSPLWLLPIGDVIARKEARDSR